MLTTTAYRQSSAPDLGGSHGPTAGLSARPETQFSVVIPSGIFTNLKGISVN